VGVADVRPEVRETVAAVAYLIAQGDAEVRQADLRARLKLDKSVISRRVADALDRGYLRNLEDRKGRPARLVMGDPLPDELEVLPQPERLLSCTVVPGGENSRPLPPRVAGRAGCPTQARAVARLRGCPGGRRPLPLALVLLLRSAREGK